MAVSQSILISYINGGRAKVTRGRCVMRTWSDDTTDVDRSAREAEGECEARAAGARCEDRRRAETEPVGADALRIETGRNGKHGAASGGAEDRQPFITA